MSEEVKYQIYVDLSDGADFVEGEYNTWEGANQKAEKLLTQASIRQVAQPNTVRYHPIHNVKLLTVSAVVKHEINPK